MRFSMMALTAAAIGLITTGDALAQSGLQNPASIQRTAFEYDNYYADDDDKVRSPSDVPAPPVGADCGYTTANCGCGDDDCNLCGDPWRLQQCDNCYGIEYGGWMEFGGTVNGRGAKSGTANAPLQFNTQSDTIVMNQLWFYVGKEVDTGGCGWDIGFRVDYVFGTDGPDTQAGGDIGYDTLWDSGRDYGSALPQLYLDVAYNDLTLRLGHFYTIIGYEVVPGTGNFFYSHSYQQYYAEPFTHTGILAMYEWDDQVSFTAGWTQGWDSGFNNSNRADMFLGSVTWTSYDEDTSLIYAVSAGQFGNGVVGNTGNIYMHSVVFTQKFCDDWTYVLHSDYADNSNSGLGTGAQQWGGISQYLIKEINCCWSAGLRFEWFSDSDGVRLEGVGNNAAITGAAINNLPGDYYDVTAGLNWKPNANLNIRPEVRYDWVRGGNTPFNSGSGVNASQDLFTFAVDVIFTF